MLKNLDPKNSLKDIKVSKEQLEQAEQSFRQAIENQFGQLEDQASRWGKNILVISGVALLAFGITRALTHTGDEETSDSNKGEEGSNTASPVAPQESPIIKAIKEQVAMFLAAWAKKKIMELLEKMDRLDEAVVEGEAEELDDQAESA